MYRRSVPKNTSIRLNQSSEGESIEQKMERILQNGEGIEDGAPIIYTERKDGVSPEHDIRTDRFDVAIDAMDAVAGAHISKREDAIQKRKEALEGLKKPDGDGKTESTGGTSEEATK